MSTIPRLIEIAIKTAHGAPLKLASGAEITISEGIVGNVPETSYRRVTLISKEHWADVVAQAGVDLPWQTRRANLLVEGLNLGELTGKTVRIGTVELNINGETKPCSQMDAAHSGLKNLLKPHCRGGMYASVQKGGKLNAGDTIFVMD